MISSDDFFDWTKLKLMSSYFETKDPLKKPDEFVTLMDKLGHYVLKYQIPLVAIFIFACLLIMGALFLKNKNENDIITLNQKLYEALGSSDPQKELEVFIKENGQSKVGYVAHLKLFQKLKEEKNVEAATQEILLAQSAAPEFLKPVLAYSYAGWQWQQGKSDEALASLDGIKETALIWGDAQLLKAVILESTGKVEESKKIYQGLAENKDKDPFAAEQAKTNLWYLMMQDQK